MIAAILLLSLIGPATAAVGYSLAMSNLGALYCHGLVVDGAYAYILGSAFVGVSISG